MMARSPDRIEKNASFGAAVLLLFGPDIKEGGLAEKGKEMRYKIFFAKIFYSPFSNKLSTYIKVSPAMAALA